MKILVTGANGQLGRCIKDATRDFSGFSFLFASREELDLENSDYLAEVFAKNDFDYCINTAAYTNVEKAESEPQKAFKINAEVVKNLANLCKENNVTLIQISTDYVFDGKKGTSYTEEDETNPINVYGASKLKGEQYVQEICERYFILRTSWLYSQYGHNFYKTVLRVAKEGKPLTITTEQTGTPTNANDLAEVILQIIKKESNKYGIYNLSNTGEATWYDFAKEILLQTGQLTSSNLAKSDHYPTFAARPKYSVLDTIKYKNIFKKDIVDWRESLKTLLNK